MTINTDYSSQCDILNNIWVDYDEVEDERLQHCFNMFDVGFPLAHAIAEGIVQSTPLAQECIEETFKALLSVFGVEDTGFKVPDFKALLEVCGVEDPCFKVPEEIIFLD